MRGDTPEPEEARAIERLIDVVRTLRAQCPWDAKQTQKSLVSYLIEETAEAVEAIEENHVGHMVEELGDVLFEVIFHATIAEEDGTFTLTDLAQGAADKLISRHTWVFGGQEIPDDVSATWEKNKIVEKGRMSALDDIPDPLSALARANKVVTRIRHNSIPTELPEEPITTEQVGRQIMEIVARAQAWQIDPDQALRAAVRELEHVARRAEASQ